MKLFIFLAGFLFFGTFVIAQDQNLPVEVTPAIEKKIRQEIEKEVIKLKADLKIANESEAVKEFASDTFRIEKYAEKYMSYDWSTAGMRSATYSVAEGYDKILNKYYKKLLAVLKPADKPVLIKAQKAWITFRDSENKLVDTISKDEYSGGGTIQQLNDASAYEGLIKDRAITIFGHYLRATQSE